MQPVSVLCGTRQELGSRVSYEVVLHVRLMYPGGAGTRASRGCLCSVLLPYCGVYVIIVLFLGGVACGLNRHRYHSLSKQPPTFPIHLQVAWPPGLSSGWLLLHVDNHLFLLEVDRRCSTPRTMAHLATYPPPILTLSASNKSASTRSQS